MSLRTQTSPHAREMATAGTPSSWEHAERFKVPQNNVSIMNTEIFKGEGPCQHILCEDSERNRMLVLSKTPFGAKQFGKPVNAMIIHGETPELVVDFRPVSPEKLPGEIQNAKALVTKVNPAESERILEYISQVEP